MNNAANYVCADCGHEFAYIGMFPPCPNCGDYNCFISTGVSTPEPIPVCNELSPVSEYEYELGFELDNLERLLTQKHAAYGSKNLLKHGLDGIIVRIDDKIARLQNLLHNNAPQNDESITDTLMDIAGYAIQAILLKDGKLTDNAN